MKFLFYGPVKKGIGNIVFGIIHSRHWRSLLSLLRDGVVGSIDINFEYSCRTRVAHMDPSSVSYPIPFCFFFAFFGELSLEK